MTISSVFIARPVATILLTLGIALAGAMAFFMLPVSPLPQVDFPTISVNASMAGASPETMATSVATPLERHLGQISGVSEMTSMSSVGSVRVILQFELNRDIDGAARDVQAAINAARADLPTSLKSTPTYKKMNPADAPVMILALTSNTLTMGQLYDSAATVLQQKLAQMPGIGQVSIGGSSLPAVRADLNPHALFKYGISLEDVRAALAAANANTPKGALDSGDRRYQVYTNDQARVAADYRSLIVAYRDATPVRLSDLGDVIDSVEDLRNIGMANGQPAVLLILYRQPGANIIETVDGVRAALTELRKSIPADIDMTVTMDRTTTIRAALSDVEHTLVISVFLVIVVVFVFLRDVRATLIPSVAVPVSLIATFGVMYLLDFSLNNLSLMALTIATGFVVDDAIVVLENTVRHMEAGMPRRRAALLGARQVGFTVVSMSLSLVAVFIPILLMSGIVGRLFREFAITLSVAILVSLVVSLTTTPMMCARWLPVRPHAGRSAFHRVTERALAALASLYERTLDHALHHPALTLTTLAATVALNAYLFVVIPKGFFPQQDTGAVIGGVMADQGISFQAMRDKMSRFLTLVKSDPAVANAVGFTGGAQTNSGFTFIALKPLSERKISADAVVARLRPKLAQVEGASMFLQPVQDFRKGGRPANAQYQYTLEADDLGELLKWTPLLTAELEKSSILTDVNSDQQTKGLELNLVVDRDAAARLGLTASQIDATLYDAFGQRSVSTIYNDANQYHVIMELAPRFWQNPDALELIHISTSGAAVSGTQSTNAVSGSSSAVSNQRSNTLGSTAKGSASTGTAISTSVETMVPLSAIAHYEFGNTPLGVNHQGHYAASTIAFNLPEGVALSEAVREIDEAAVRIGMPSTLHGGFQGTAQAFQQNASNQPLLILAAIVAVYIVLGILYESTIHPLTILSTLPSAGVGAVLALMAFDTEFSVIALIGVFLLIGIVKKNAIMMIDFAIDAQRNQRLPAPEAIRQACLLRFRPIMMTTMVALLGALPLAFGTGDGAELRRPLGISIVGGLLVSQVLTLYTTPVVYLYLERLRVWLGGARTPEKVG